MPSPANALVITTRLIKHSSCDDETHADPSVTPVGFSIHRHPGQGCVHAQGCARQRREHARHEDRQRVRTPPSSSRFESRRVIPPSHATVVAQSKSGFSLTFHYPANPSNHSESKTFDDDWLKADVTVHLLTLFGWAVPSGIAIKSYGDTSLLSAFSASIGENLANFPQGPGLEDKFWLYLLTWHIGLFSTMLLGQIGWQGRKQGYFK